MISLAQVPDGLLGRDAHETVQRGDHPGLDEYRAFRNQRVADLLAGRRRFTEVYGRQRWDDGLNDLVTELWGWPQ
jgi:hypothetical protein